MDDQVLDLALMTNYSQSTFMWTVASSLSVLHPILSGLVIQQAIQLLRNEEVPTSIKKCFND